MASNSRSARERPLAGSLRYHPYGSGASFGKEEMKEEVVRLGVELSLSVAESMFLLSDGIHSMLWFCFKIWRGAIPHWAPVSQRLLRVMHYVYSKDIKPNEEGVLHQDKISPNSLHCVLIGTAWKDFAYGIRVLHRYVLFLRSKDRPYDDRLSFLSIAKYNREVLKKLDDKLRPAKDVSQANGFARDTIESHISDFWNSLFDDEEDQEATPEALNIRICDLFQPILGESWRKYAANSSGQPILEIPKTLPPVLGLSFAEQELKEEVVQLGVELSLYVAQSMFLLCDDIRSILLFCYKLWTDAKKDLKQPDSPVMERLLRVIHYVYSKHIKPKNGEFQSGGKSVQWRLAKTTWKDFHAGIRDLDLLVSIRGREGRYLDGQELATSIDEALKKVEEKLRCAKGVSVSEANGFARDAVESNILDIWKSLFDKETEDAWALNMMRVGILTDLFHPLKTRSKTRLGYY